MRRVCVGLAALVVFVAATGRAPAGVINGGFEHGSFAGWTQFGDTSFTGIDSGFLYPPFEGNFYAAFGPSFGIGGILQDVPTVAGHDYFVEFSVISDGLTPNELLFTWDGVLFVDELDIDTGANWFTFSGIFTATTSSTEIAFGFFDGSSSIGLDSVSVTSLPEPSTLTLAGVAGLGLAGAAWRRRARRN